MKLTEEDTKARKITPAIQASGWKIEQIYFEHQFTDGKVIVNGRTAKRGKKKKADYLLTNHNNFPIAIVEAKSDEHDVDTGIQQAIDYARILDVPFAYSSNGDGFLEHDMLKGTERLLSMSEFPSEGDLWKRYKEHKGINEEVEQIIKHPYHYTSNSKSPRYYQRIAINRAVESVAFDNKRLMLVMATGTGKTFTAFQIIHRLYEVKKVKKVLFLADRNILVDQTLMNDFEPFSKKNIITKVKKKHLDSSYNIYMSLYQQLSGDEDEEAYLQFKPDYFDLIVIDECHRGSADENSAWRKILDYFSSAIHLGMTATPKEETDISNSNYFGEAIYTYSLKEGIEDGFLAPYRVIRVGLDVDLMGYTPEEGKLDDYGQELPNKIFTSKDFDKTLILPERTQEVAKRVTEFLLKNGKYHKTIVFCENERHAGEMRQALINLNPEEVAKDDRYVMRITGNDDLGKAQLENFINTNSVYPVIATTAELLSTGVDCKMCKLIVLDKSIKSMTKFKQIVGRGTRLLWDKDKRYFTIMDFRKATELFSDPEFDGSATSVYVQPEEQLPGLEEEPKGIDIDEDDYAETDNRVFKLAGVDANILTEIELTYGADGKLILNQVDAFKTIITEKYKNKEEFIKDWMTNNKQDIISYFEELGIDFGRLLKNVGTELDVYDIILLYGFNLDAKLKTERVNNVITKPFIQNLTEDKKAIIIELLEVYRLNDIHSIERPEVFKLHNFDKFGGVGQIIRKINKKEHREILRQIVDGLYE